MTHPTLTIEWIDETLQRLKESIDGGVLTEDEERALLEAMREVLSHEENWSGSLSVEGAVTNAVATAAREAFAKSFEEHQ